MNATQYLSGAPHAGQVHGPTRHHNTSAQLSLETFPIAFPCPTTIPCSQPTRKHLALAMDVPRDWPSRLLVLEQRLTHCR